MADKLIPTTVKAAQAYENTIDVFEPMFREIKEMSKKKPDMIVSKFKVMQVNRLLTDIHSFLKEEPEGKYLDLLNDDELPQASDIVLVMSQYEGALKSFRSRHYDDSYVVDDWFIE